MPASINLCAVDPGVGLSNDEFHVIPDVLLFLNAATFGYFHARPRKSVVPVPYCVVAPDHSTPH